ncbi:hypothetical protein DFP93_105175 [Aneurinibacillus soli]|uniref:Uncharacterized protein n=1 Tax=Aneurinibacillus soli TaxID=1500254 RepID=A0A0U5B2Q9_9BACL|nr:hypothetical protein [Aneurinibacillus soli]PYE62220.1 hypothetical protein DFP93_105175 [Aneurinibacillus soli]BAU28592.1 hypothetical protein CB4_02767 [Aneurinibacillus soli]
MFKELKQWYSKRQERARKTTLASLMEPLIGIPVTLLFIKFLQSRYGYGQVEWKIIFIMVFFIFNAIISELALRFSGRLGLKIIKQPYYFLATISILLTWLYIFGVFD